MSKKILTFRLVLPEVNKRQCAAELGKACLRQGERVLCQTHPVVQTERGVLLGRFGRDLDQTIWCVEHTDCKQPVNCPPGLNCMKRLTNASCSCIKLEWLARVKGNGGLAFLKKGSRVNICLAVFSR